MFLKKALTLSGSGNSYRRYMRIVLIPDGHLIFIKLPGNIAILPQHINTQIVYPHIGSCHPGRFPEPQSHLMTQYSNV